MAVYLKPCTGCPLREGCEQRDEYRRRVSGLGLRSATFRCQRLADALQHGTRVTVMHPITVEVGGGYEGPEYSVTRVELPATINSSDGVSFSCVIDRDALEAALSKAETDTANIDKYRFRRTMPARRIVRFLDEPRRRTCEGGGRFMLPDGTCDRRADEDCVCKVFAHHIKAGAAA